MPEVEKIVIDRVTTFGRKPKTPTQVLRQARDLLAEEGRWCTGTMFEDGDAEAVFEDVASCGSWSACAVGAIGLVSGDFKVKVRKEWEEMSAHEYEVITEWRDAITSGRTFDSLEEWFKIQQQAGRFQEGYAAFEWDADFFPTEGSLSWDACILMSNAIDADDTEEEFGHYSAGPNKVIQFNDEFTNRENLLEMFDKAIALGHKQARKAK